jgi:hypothetical protein
MKNKFSVFISIFIASFVFLFLPSNALAATYYVDATGGNNSNDGSSGSPWQTLQYAENTASNGDTVNVAAGTYIEDDPTNHAWTVSKGISWVATGAVTVRASTTATRVLHVTGTNTSSFTGFTFDSEGTRSSVVTFASTSASNKTFTNCTFQNGTGFFIVPSGTVTNFLIDQSTFILNNAASTAYLAAVGDQVLSNNIFSVTNATTVVRVSGAGTNLDFNNNSVTSSTLVQVFNVSANSILEVTDNTFTINGITTRILYLSSGTGSLTFGDNIVTSASAIQAIYVSGGVWTTSIVDNTITSTSSSPSQALIQLLNQNSPQITNNNIETTSTDAIAHIQLSSTGTSGGTANISDNTLISKSLTGHVISVGTEGSTSGNNMFDGALIENNTIYGPLYYDPDLSAFSTHTIFVGYNKNAIIRYNTVIGGGYAVVVKGGGEAYTSGGIYYNTFINNAGTTSIRVKGIKNIKILNNTINVANNFQQNYTVIFISENGVGESSTGTVLKNNIIVGGKSELLRLEDVSITGLDSDYNLFYRHSAGNFVDINSVVYSSLASWNLAGYDIHSVNSLPVFVNDSSYNYKLQSSSPGINNGVNVSLNNDHIGSSVPQGSSPDIGAYEFLMPDTATSPLQFRTDGTTAITTGTTTTEDDVVLKLTMSSTNDTDSLTPQLEVRPVGEDFTDTVTHSGTAVAYSGSSVTGTVSVTGLSDGEYHWQARVSNAAGQSSWVSYGGNAESAADFVVAAPDPTPTPTTTSSSNSSSSSSSSSSPSAPGCSDTAPAGTPDLFQIDRTGDSAKLYFTPVNDRVQSYNVIFGHSDGDERYGGISMHAQNENKGVQSITIDHLDPKANYSFKVISTNGCATGEWSNWLGTGKLQGKTSIFYRYWDKVRNIF